MHFPSWCTCTDLSYHPDGTVSVSRQWSVNIERGNHLTAVSGQNTNGSGSHSVCIRALRILEPLMETQSSQKSRSNARDS
jgi:hypothetical protein